MKKAKLKGALFVALAASSILMNSNAMATALNTVILDTDNANDAQNAGCWKTNGNNSAVNGKIDANSNIIFGDNNKVLSIGAPNEPRDFGYLNLYGHISTLTISDGAGADNNYSVLSIVNDYTTNSYIADAKAANGDDLNPGNSSGAQLTLNIDDANNTLEVKGADLSGLKELKFGASGVLKLSGEGAQLGNNVTITPSAANTGVITVNAKDVKLSPAFADDNAINVLNISDNCSATVSKDFNVNLTSIGTGSTLNLDSYKFTTTSIAKKNGATNTTLTLNSATITGKIDNVDNVSLLGGDSTISGSVTTSALNINPTAAGATVSLAANDAANASSFGAISVSNTADASISLAKDATFTSLSLDDKTKFTLKGGKSLTGTTAFTLSGDKTADINLFDAGSSLSFGAGSINVGSSTLNLYLNDADGSIVSKAVALTNGSLNIASKGDNVRTLNLADIVMDKDSKITVGNSDGKDVVLAAKIDGAVDGSGVLYFEGGGMISGAIGSAHKIGKIIHNDTDGANDAEVQLSGTFKAGQLIIKNGQISFGGGGEVDSVSFAAGADKSAEVSIVDYDITAGIASIDGPGIFKFTGNRAVKKADGSVVPLTLNLAGNGAKIVYDGATSFHTVVPALGAENAKLTQEITASSNALVASGDISYPVSFTGDGTLTLKDGKLLAALTTSTDGKGSLLLSGNTIISKPVGEADKKLKLLQLGNNAATVEISDKVHAPIMFTKVNQVLTVNGGQIEGVSHDDQANNTCSVNIGSGSTVNGAIDFIGVLNVSGGSILKDSAITTSEFNAQDSIFQGAEYSGAHLNLSGNNSFTHTAAVVELKNVKTVAAVAGQLGAGSSSAAVITAADGAKLKFTGGNTLLAEGTEFRLNFADDALDMSQLGVANFGGGKVHLSSAGDFMNTADSAEAMLANVKQTKALKASAEVAELFNVKRGHFVTARSEFDNVNLYLKITETVDQAAFNAALKVSDVTKPFSQQASDVFSDLNSASDLDASKKALAAADAGPSHQATTQAITSSVRQGGLSQSGLEQGSVAAGDAGDASSANVFIMPFAARVNTDSSADMAGSKTNLYGASFGMIAGLNEEQAHLGLAFSLAKSKSTFKDAKNGDKADGSTKAATVFGDFSNGSWYSEGLMSAGVTDFTNNESRRGLAYTGKYQTKFFSLASRLGYKYALPEADVMPYFSLEYDYTQDPAYNLESGANKIAVAKRTANKFTPKVGAKFSKAMKIDIGSITPFFDASIGYMAGSKTKAKDVDLGNLMPILTYNSDNEFVFNARLGFDLATSKGAKVSMNLGYDLVGKNTKVYSGSVKLGYDL